MQTFRCEDKNDYHHTSCAAWQLYAWLVYSMAGVVSSGQSVRFKVGRPGFNVLIESHQKAVKIVFPAFLLGTQHEGIVRSKGRKFR